MRTKIKLHGVLAEQMEQSEWNLHVESPREALHAINVLTDNKLNKNFAENDKANIKYRVLIDGKDFVSPSKYNNASEDLDLLKEDIANACNSELCLNKKAKTIDVVPVIEGADEIATIVIGVVLIVVGIILLPTGFGGYFIAAGLALVAAGITALLMEPPEFGDIKKIEGTTSASYLFMGPVNTIKEGGPVPIIYGEVLAGSQVVSAYYDFRDVNATAGQLSV
jgi:predicted phage tail protein